MLGVLFMQKKMTGWIIAAALVAGMGADVFAANGDAYTWPGYRSDLDYDTKSNLGDIQPPTKFNNNCSQEVRYRFRVPVQ